MRYSGLTLLAVVLSSAGLAAELDRPALPFGAPIVDGFNDPDAIHYDAAHEAELERTQEELSKVKGFEDWGLSVTVNMEAANGRIEKRVRIHGSLVSPMGTRFREEHLIHFLARRVNGDLREGKTHSKFLVSDVCSVIEICGDGELKSTLPLMLKLIDDPNEDVRSSAYYVLAFVGADDPEVFKVVSKAMAEDRRTRELAPNMWRFGEKGMPILLKLIAKRPSSLLIEYLGYFGDHRKDALPTLTAFLDDHDSEIRRAAMDVLAGIGAPAESAIPALLALRDRDDNSAKDVYSTMACMSPKARDIMLADAKRRADNSYYVAIEALASARPYKDAVPILIQALADPDASMRRSAMSSLIGPEAEPAVPALISALKDTDPQVRYAAIDALAQIGASAKAAIPALKAAAVLDSGGSESYRAPSAIKEIENAIALDSSQGK